MKFLKKKLDMIYRNLIGANGLKITWADVAWILLLSFAFIFFFLVSDSVWIFNIIIIPSILIGYNKNNQLTQPQQKFLTGLTISVVITYSIRIALAVYKSILAPPEWDFQLYWIYGQVGSHNLNPYDPNNLIKFAQTLNPSEGFFNELYFFQFPTLIFLFLPLGWLDINNAALLWYGFLLIVLILDIILLWSIFFNGQNHQQLLLVTLLTLVLTSTFETLGHAQINFIVLLIFLLYWKNNKSFTGGVWLGLGMIVKPILAIVLIYPLLRRHLRSLTGVAVSIVVSSALTIIAFGPEMFLAYFADNPILHNMPNYLYIEEINQSLLATILRITNYDFSNGSPYLQPMFIITAVLLTGITGFLILRGKDGDEHYSGHTLALTITFALLLFPKTLTHYAVLLIVPILMIWVNQKELDVSFWIILIFTTAEYVLVSLGGNFVFVSVLMTWLFIAGICASALPLMSPPKQEPN